MENLVSTVEAILFAAGVPISRKEILDHLPDDVSRKNLNDAIDKLAAKYSGTSGILLQQFDDKVQFCSNDLYKDIVSEALQPVKEKELSKSLLEVLSIIAYYQPITRAEIEEYRGGASADYALSMLQRVDLIYVSEYKQAPGRPVLFSTTDAFLKRFDLMSLDDLPDASEVKRRMMEIGNFTALQEGLYREDGMNLEDEDQKTSFELQQESELSLDDDDVPEFLKDSNFDTYSGSDSDDVGELPESSDDKPEDPDDGGIIGI